MRQLLIRDIQSVTKRQLIVYFANRYENAEIEQRDIALMAELCNDPKGQPTDLMLETIGGGTDATEGLISLIQTRIPDLRVVVPNAAKSNGTLLCFAAQSIVMGATSELGPIEPAVQNIPSTILTEPTIATQNFILHKYGEYALNQSKDLAKRLLTDGMMAGQAKADIDETVKKLASRDVFFSHGSVINYKEADALGLKVDYLEPGDSLWQQFWLLYCMYDFDSRRNRYLKIFEGPNVSTSIAAPLPQPASP